MEIKGMGGALYTQDGRKLADIEGGSIVTADEPCKQRMMKTAANIGKTHSITYQLAPYDTRIIYSIM